MQNVHTGEYVTSFTKNATHMGSELEAATITLGWLTEGQNYLKIGNNHPMHAQSDHGAIVDWSAEKDNASAWIIEEYEGDIAYPLTISKYGLAGLYLNYPVAIPNGLNAYAVSTAEGAGGIAKLKKIENGVIPANEGVILEGGANESFTLNYSDAATSEISNLLEGVNYTSYVEGEGDTRYYLFGAKSGVVGLYWTYMQYNADGTITDGNANTDDGTHFKCTANKVFLPYNAGSGATKFKFRFNDTTDIEDLLNGLTDDTVIYDIQGRRIQKVTESGFYIVNGKKRYIDAK